MICLAPLRSSRSLGALQRPLPTVEIVTTCGVRGRRIESALDVGLCGRFSDAGPVSEVPRAVGPAYETSKGGNRAGGTCDEAALAISNGEPELQSGLVVKEEARARQGRHLVGTHSVATYRSPR